MKCLPGFSHTNYNKFFNAESFSTHIYLFVTAFTKYLLELSNFDPFTLLLAIVLYFTQN